MRTTALGCCLLLAAACGGCFHSPANYPGAGGSNIDPADYVSSACPNLSGTFDGNGMLVDGDLNAQQWEKTRRIDYLIPFADDAELVAFFKAADSDGPPKSRSYPTVGEIRMVGARSFQFSVHYANGKIGSHVASFEDKATFVCTGAAGKIIWGGATEGARSEFGPNKSDSSVMLYLDDRGDLIFEKTTQIHMSMLFGVVPTGTARYFAKYRFQRIR